MHNAEDIAATERLSRGRRPATPAVPALGLGAACAGMLVKKEGQRLFPAPWLGLGRKVSSGDSSPTQ